MTVKVKRKMEMMRTEFEATIYLPEEQLLTKERREKADKLDKIIQIEVGKINKEYDTLAKKTRTVEIEKWRWLGSKISHILSTSLMEQGDIDNHHIWPAIGQYLRKELSRGLDDSKRSGTRNDHYRKCWALATLPGTSWVTSWIGWDAFTDRGDQLVYSGKLMHLLEKRFGGLERKLTPDDFKAIAKLLVKYIPTKAKTPKDIGFLPDNKLDEIAEAIFQDFIKGK